MKQFALRRQVLRTYFVALALFLERSFRVAGFASADDALARLGPDVPVLVTDMRLGDDRHGGLRLAGKMREWHAERLAENRERTKRVRTIELDRHDDL